MTIEDLNKYLEILTDDQATWQDKFNVIEKLRTTELKTKESKEIFVKSLLDQLIQLIKHQQDEISTSVINCLGSHPKLTKNAVPELITAIGWKHDIEVRKAIVYALANINGTDTVKAISDYMKKTPNKIEIAFCALALARIDLNNEGLPILVELFKEGRLTGWLAEQFNDLTTEKTIQDMTKRIEDSKQMAEANKQIENYQKVIKEQENLIKTLQIEIRLTKDELNKFKHYNIFNDRKLIESNLLIKSKLENKRCEKQHSDWKITKSALQIEKPNMKHIVQFFEYFYDSSRLFRLRDVKTMFDKYAIFVFRVDLPYFSNLFRQHITIIHQLGNESITEDNVEFIDVLAYCKDISKLSIVFTNKIQKELMNPFGFQGQILINKKITELSSYFKSIFTLDLTLLMLIFNDKQVKKYIGKRENF